MSSSEANSAPATIDLDALRERYRIERERRAPRTGERQYQDIDDGFAHLATDPYAVAVAREPLDDEVDVLVVGGGFGGLLAAARLREAGVKKIRIVEAGSDVGGTWYWNRYPGAACDVESYIYLPLLEETGYMPVERYSRASEILAHARRIAEHFRLYDDACLSTQVTSLDWNEATAWWTVRTNRGDCMQARFVVLTTGPLNRPKLPAIQGVENFKGHTFHTSRWDYAYTGGSATEPLARLRDKRIGIIGTGATAIQCVPPLAASTQHLYVFQRTPSSVGERNNSATDPDWAASLEPGWQKRRMESFTSLLAGDVFTEDLVGDGWTVLAHAVRATLAANPKVDPTTLLERADLERVAQIRDRVQSTVRDPATAEALKPWYSLFCKRPCFHDEYLDVFNQPNVTLVDTAGRGVERITETGVVVDGTQYPLDCLIFATGFEVSTDFAKRSGFEIHGVGGLALTDKWSEGIATLHGMHSRGFPNCFVISHVQSGMSPNFPHMLDEQATHVAHIVSHSVAHGVKTVEASADAEQAWVQTIVAMGEVRRKFLESCTPGYYNDEGRVSQSLARSFPFGAGPVAFIELLRKWRAEGTFAGLELDGKAVNTGGKRKSIFITGAASGIGRETARLFARKGWFVGAFDLDGGALDALQEEIGADNGLFAPLDVADRAAFIAAVDRFGAATGGTLDLLFNNAGTGVGGFFDDVAWDDVVKVVNVNLLGVMIGIQAAVPLLKATPGALCLTTSSSSSIFGTAGIAVYSATKHAVRGLTEALSIELKRYGVRAADLVPGLIDTAILPDRMRAIAPTEGMWRLVPPAEVAQAVWSAYHGDLLHWYVPLELKTFDLQATAAPEIVREERAKLPVFAD